MLACSWIFAFWKVSHVCLWDGRLQRIYLTRAGAGWGYLTVHLGVFLGEMGTEEHITSFTGMVSSGLGAPGLPVSLGILVRVHPQWIYVIQVPSSKLRKVRWRQVGNSSTTYLRGVLSVDALSFHFTKDGLETPSQTGLESSFHQCNLSLNSKFSATTPVNP